MEYFTVTAGRRGPALRLTEFLRAGVDTRPYGCRTLDVGATVHGRPIALIDEKPVTGFQLARVHSILEECAIGIFYSNGVAQRP